MWALETIPVLLLVLIIEMSLPSPENDLVIDVGGVHNKLDIKVEIVSKNTTNDVCGDIVSGMTQVGVIIDSRTASVP